MSDSKHYQLYLIQSLFAGAEQSGNRVSYEANTVATLLKVNPELYKGDIDREVEQLRSRYIFNHQEIVEALVKYEGIEEIVLDKVVQCKCSGLSLRQVRKMRL